MKINFGSIIVGGSGKINGNCVRNFRGTALLTRLPKPTQTLNLRNNPQKTISKEGFRAWALLAQGERETWDYYATLIQRKNVFGVLQNYTGRTLYTMVVMNLLKASHPIIETADFKTDVPICSFERLDISVSMHFADLVNFDGSGSAKTMLYFKLLNNERQNPTEKNLKFYGAFRGDENEPESLYFLLSSFGIPLAVGNYFAVGLRTITDSGLVSPMQIYTGVMV